MGTLGRNVHLLQSPIKEHRLGRLKTGATALPIGAPVTAGTYDTADKRRPLALAAEASAPLVGKTGVLVWDEAWTNFHGSDPVLTTRSDIIDAPAHTPVQMVHGTEVRWAFTNTVDRSFQGQRDYDGRVIVNMTGLAIDNLLTPGVGNDTDGYWKKTTDATLAWFRVTAIYTATGRVEAQQLF